MYEQIVLTQNISGGQIHTSHKEAQVRVWHYSKNVSATLMDMTDMSLALM